MAVDDRLEEKPEHLLGHVEVGDDAVLEGPHGENAVGGPAQHALRFESDALDLASSLLDRDDRGLVQHDALALHVDQRIGGAEIHGNLICRAPGSDSEVRPAKRHVSSCRLYRKGDAGAREQIKVMKCVTSNKDE